MGTMAAQKIESVAKALTILMLFKMNKDEWGVSEIARELGMQKSTVFRLLATMQDYGFVRKSDNNTYRLGLRVLELGSIVANTFNFRDVTGTYLRKVSEQCGETVHLGILDDCEAMSIETVEAQNTLKSTIVVGKRTPLYCTSVGKAILAFLPEDERNAIIQKINFHKFTDNTITDANTLVEELKITRERGYALDNIEHELGVRCVAAPIWDHTGRVLASLSISGPSVRITEDRIPELSQLVLKAAHEISRELGARRIIS